MQKKKKKMQHLVLHERLMVALWFEKLLQNLCKKKMNADQKGKMGSVSERRSFFDNLVVLV